MEAREAFMLYACPSLGALLAFCMFVSPMRTVLAVNRRKQLGEVNPLPFIAMAANGMSWLAYGLYIHDYFVFGSNVSALLLGVFYVMTCSKFAEEKVQDLLRNLLLALCCAFLAVSLVFMAAGLGAAGSKALWGSTAVAILAIYYVSPLTTLAKVLRRRDSSSLHKPMLVANIGNGLLWFAYGLATHDWFLIMPNGIGAAFSFLSLAISVVFPTTERNTRLKHGAPAHSQQQQQQQQTGSFIRHSAGRRVNDAAAVLTTIPDSPHRGTGPVARLLGIVRVSSCSRTAAVAKDLSPLEAEQALQNAGTAMESCNGGAAAAQQQLLHMHSNGRVTGSRQGGGDGDGKDSSMV